MLKVNKELLSAHLKQLYDSTYPIFPFSFPFAAQ